MTPTDFWLICPNNQLRLPNNQPCSGPDYDSINCIKHAVWHNQPGYVAQPFQYFPNRLVSIMVAGIEKGAFSKSWFSPMVKALHQRSGFLKERMNKLDRVIAPTRIMETMLTKHGMDPDRIVFSQYGIQSVARKPRIPSQQGRFRLGFIGGLSEHKGAHVLVSAVRLLAHLPEIELKIFGRADLNIPYIEKLQRLIDGDSRIQFCGTFPNNEIGTVFASLDTLIVPSVWYENTPLVIYSAQAGGCPVIASNLGGMSEVIQHEKNGLLFEAGNTRALADTIERIFKDKDLHMRLSENSLTPKSITTYVTELVAIYDEVLSMRDSKQ